jgi:hypothetical protein
VVNKVAIIIGVVSNVIAAVMLLFGRGDSAASSAFTAGFSYMIVWAINAELKNKDIEDCGYDGNIPRYKVGSANTATLIAWIFCWAGASITKSIAKMADLAQPQGGPEAPHVPAEAPQTYYENMAYGNEAPSSPIEDGGEGDPRASQISRGDKQRSSGADGFSGGDGDGNDGGIHW